MQGAGSNGNFSMQDGGSRGIPGMPAPGSLDGDKVDPNAPPAGNFPRDYSKPQPATTQHAPGQPTPATGQRPVPAAPSGVRPFGMSDEPPRSTPEFEYRPQGGVAKMLVFFLALAALVQFVSAGSTVLTMNFADALLRGAVITPAQLAAEGARQSIVAISGLGTWLICAILFCTWVVRANKNARGLGAEGLKTSPGLCAGWFFIPIAFWIKPYQAVREIWQASDPNMPAHSTMGWQGSDVGGAVVGWWMTWLLGVWGPGLAWLIVVLIIKPQNVTILFWIVAFGHMVTAVSGVMAINVVNGVEARQAERANARIARARTQQQPAAAAA